MPAEDDISLAEKRVYRGTGPETALFVASELGVTRVAVSGGQIGRFSLAAECDARALAGGDGRLVVATDTDVLVGTGDGFAPTGFGAAVAVALDGGDPLAAGPDGTIARLVGDDWHPLGSVTAVRAMDGDHVAAADGVYRVGADVRHVGLDDATDVAAVGPLVATGHGLFARRDGWTELFDGRFTVVAARGDRAHAVGSTLWTRQPGGSWTSGDPPVDGPIVDVAYGEVAYAVTSDGTVLVAADGTEDWRTRALGLADTRALAVP